MLAKITLENFFSFRQATTIDLNPDINILVGINGSGKSNLLKAIQLLRESIVGSGLEKVFLRDWGGFSSVSNFNTEEKDYIRLIFEFDKNAIKNMTPNQGFIFPSNPIYELTIFKSGMTSYYLKERLYAKKTKPTEGDFLYMEMSNTQGFIISNREGGKTYRHRYPQENKQIVFRPNEPILRQISDPYQFYPLFTLQRFLEEFFVYTYFDTAFNSPMRQPAPYTSETKLSLNGQNLTTVLNRLKNNHALYYDKIEELVQKINPYFKDINFDFIGAKLYLVLREKHLTKSISIEHISDGTLRYLTLLAIFLNPERGNLICLDEPEINLHPDMINTIAAAIKQASEQTQLIIATHSPLLLNSFEIDQILVFEKNNHNETIVSTKSTDELGDFLAGQAWLQGLIGGKRW